MTDRIEPALDWTPDTGIPDPLAERFEELERDVLRREHFARQDICRHERVHTLREMTGRSWRICADCGKQLPPE